MSSQSTTTRISNKVEEQEPCLFMDSCDPLTPEDVELACRWLQYADDLKQLMEDTKKQHHGRCDGCTMCVSAAHGGYLLEGILGLVEGDVSGDLRELARKAQERTQSQEERTDAELYLRTLAALHGALIATYEVEASHRDCGGCPLCQDSLAVSFTLKAYSEMLRSTAPGRVLGELLRAGMMEAPPDYVVALSR